MIDVSEYAGKRIREFRKRKGLNQIDLAERLNLSQSAYAKIENGHTALEISRLLQIAKFLEVPISDFLPKEMGQSYQFNQQDGYQNLEVKHFYADGRKLLESKDSLIKTKNNQIAHLKEEIIFLRDQLKNK